MMIVASYLSPQPELLMSKTRVLLTRCAANDMIALYRASLFFTPNGRESIYIDMHDYSHSYIIYKSFVNLTLS